MKRKDSRLLRKFYNRIVTIQDIPSVQHPFYRKFVFSVSSVLPRQYQFYSNAANATCDICSSAKRRLLRQREIIPTHSTTSRYKLHAKMRVDARDLCDKKLFAMQQEDEEEMKVEGGICRNVGPYNEDGHANARSARDAAYADAEATITVHEACRPAMQFDNRFPETGSTADATSISLGENRRRDITGALANLWTFPLAAIESRESLEIN